MNFSRGNCGWLSSPILVPADAAVVLRIIGALKRRNTNKRTHHHTLLQHQHQHKLPITSTIPSHLNSTILDSTQESTQFQLMTDIIAPTSVSLQATHTLPTDHSANNSASRQRRQRPPQQQQQLADVGGSSEKKINTRRRRPNRSEGTSSLQPQNGRIDDTQTPGTSVSTPTPEQKTRRQGSRRSNGSSSNKNGSINGTVSGTASPDQNAVGQTRNGNRLNGRKFQAGLTPQDSDEPVEATQQKKPSHQHRAPAKFVPKIEADRDLLTSLTVGLTSSKYECMVCFDVIRPAHKIWNCQVCWAAFHLDCLSTWAKKSVGGKSKIIYHMWFRWRTEAAFSFVPKV